MKNPIAELLCIDDADQLHVMRLTIALTGRLELDDAEVELAQDGSFDEGHVLDVLEWNGLLHRDKLALLSRLVRHRQAEPPIPRLQPCHRDAEARLEPKVQSLEPVYGL